MASVPLSSLCFSQRNVSSLNFSYGVSDTLGFASGSLGFSSSSKKNRGVRVFICRASSSAAVFRDLDADDFRHPLDKQNTLLLRVIPGLNEIGKAILGTMTEQIMLLENIGTSVVVSENQFLWGLGLLESEAESYDVYALDEKLLAMVPQPVLVVLFLYPLTAKDPTAKVYFMKQTVGKW